MAKVTGPLLSIGARGSIAKTIVMASWKGVAYARQHVVPSNPRTTAQVAARNRFSGLDDQYKRMLGFAQAPWTLAAQGRPYTGRNRFLEINAAALSGETDFTNYLGSPGVNGGLPGLNPTAAGGVSSGEIDATLDFGQNPVDWMADFVTFTAFPDRAPEDPMTGFVVEAQVAGPGDSYSPPITVSHTFTGLDAGVDYVVSMFPQWTRADGFIAYGPASTIIATATV